jgi:hypothetical protein
MIDPLTGKVILCEECEQNVLEYLYGPGDEEDSFETLALYYI